MKSKYKVIVSDKFDHKGIARLREQERLILHYKEDANMARAELLELVDDAQVLILRSATQADKELLSKARELRLIIRAGVGVDNVDVLEASRRGIIVSNAPGGNSISTAEQALALLFACARKIPQAHASMKAKKWEKNKFKGIELTGKTLGVFGLGRIGKELAQRATALRMKVIAYDPYIRQGDFKYPGVDLGSKEEILQKADFITVHTPLTESTRDLIHMGNLHTLKDGVILINAARGGIYNEEALVRGLETKKIAALGLDVYTQSRSPRPRPCFSLRTVL